MTTSRSHQRPVRRFARRRRVVLLVVLLIAALLVGFDLTRGERRSTTGTAPPTAGAGTPSAGTSTGPPYAGTRAGGPDRVRVNGATPTPAPTYPADGPGDFGYATEEGPMLGTAGTLQRFRVAVEDGMGQDVASFAAAADTILGDTRSWPASGQVRLQHVPGTAAADFTLYLATPGTSERMCAAGGLQTERFTSCRLPGQVIINVARWQEAIPDYGAPLDVYRAYVINHEVGHELGYGHESCPGPGLPAPVMQQQTYGLKGCLANSWPFLEGQRYIGPPVP